MFAFLTQRISFSPEKVMTELRQLVLPLLDSQLDHHQWQQDMCSPRHPLRHARYEIPRKSLTSLLSLHSEAQRLLRQFPECRREGRLFTETMPNRHGDLMTIKLETQRDFTASYLYGDPNARSRFLYEDIWGNCLEFVYLIYLRAGILTEQELEQIASTRYEMFVIFMNKLKLYCHQKVSEAQPGDLVIWFRKYDGSWNHIGFISKNLNGDLFSISLEKQINFQKFSVYEGRLNDRAVCQQRTPYYIDSRNFLEILNHFIDSREWVLPPEYLPTRMQSSLSFPTSQLNYCSNLPLPPSPR